MKRLEPLIIVRRSELAGTNRSSVYIPQIVAKKNEWEMKLRNAINAEYMVAVK